jgi:5S rRNA maturation endonuclease (ribonuclease M5)
VKCHTGCPIDDILSALGLTISDLFDEPRQAKQGNAVVAEYPYIDETGTVLYVKQRLWPKAFRQYVPDPLKPGGKQWSLNGVRRILFHLPELIAAKTQGETIYLAEGEADVLALERAGVAATTRTEGAWQPGDRAKWRTEYSQTLTGMHVIIVRDRDNAGQHTAKDIAAQLAQHAASIKIVEAAEGKDAADHIAADHIAAGYNVDELVPVVDAEATTDQPLTKLADLVTQLRGWQHLPDPVHVIATLTAATTRNADGEPCWLLMVAPPSSGKTETARLLDDTADARLNEVTAADLLSWSKGKAKTVKPTGILTKINNRGLATFGDLSSLLATSDRGGRDQVFGLLRRAYDGYVTRDIAPPNGADTDQQLKWSGRLTVVACVTGAIDRYTAHADQLGPRWIYIRIPERSTDEKRRASQLARRSDLSTYRAAARKTVAELLAQLPAELPELPDDIADDIEDAALVTAWGRAAVPRNGYGRREIEGIPIVEEPMRLVQQLNGIARRVLALGLPATAAGAIARRIALDSMPEARRAVLQVLATGEVLSTSACARQANLHRRGQNGARRPSAARLK